MNDEPTPGKQYLLIGGSKDKAISNGNTWEESEVKEPTEFDKFLKKVAQYTQVNNHTHARIIIALQYDYLQKHYGLLRLIKDIQNIEGNMPFPLITYREEITERMIQAIQEKEGKEIAEKIYQVL